MARNLHLRRSYPARWGGLVVALAAGRSCPFWSTGNPAQPFDDFLGANRHLSTRYN